MKDDTCDKVNILDILSIIVETESPTQKKDVLVVLGYYEESRMLLSKSDVEANLHHYVQHSKKTG